MVLSWGKFGIFNELWVRVGLKQSIIHYFFLIFFEEIIKIWKNSWWAKDIQFIIFLNNYKNLKFNINKKWWKNLIVTIKKL